MANYKIVDGFVVELQTRPVKNGKNGPRVQNHSWSVPEVELESVLSFLKAGFTFNGETYAFQENPELGRNPKLKIVPEWSGMATVNGSIFTCHVFPGTCAVSTQ